MRGSLFFLAAALVAPSITAPLSAATSISERRSVTSITDLIPTFLKREPIIEAIPGPSSNKFLGENKRGLETRTENQAGEDAIVEGFEKRYRGQPAGGAGSKTRDLEERFRGRPAGGAGSKTRSLEERFRGRPAGGAGSKTRGLEERFRGRPAGGAGSKTRSLEERFRGRPAGGA